MELQLWLLVAGAAVIVGAAIVVVGVRLLRSGDRRSMAARRRPSRPGEFDSFTVSGAVFVIVGVMVLVLAVWMFAQVNQEMMTAVSPLSSLDLDKPAPSAEDVQQNRDRLGR